MPRRFTKLNLRNALTAFFTIYIIALSFVPLVHETLLAESRWIGYGSGTYQYQNQNYFILFNDPYDGSSKPHIHVNPGFAPAERISLVEFSDWTTYVNDHNLFNEFNATVRTNQTTLPRVLNITYSSPEIVVHKFIDVSSDSVKITMNSTKEFRAHLELWKWVMTSVNGVSLSDTTKPLIIAPTTSIEFTYEDDRLQSVGRGRILLSSLPVQVQIWPHVKGFNKITIDFVNSRMVFTISGSMETVETSSPSWSYTLLPYILPVVATAVVALYLLVGKYGRTLKDRVTRRSS